MRINNISLQGMFPYKPGIQYETNDMIMYDDILYVVTSSYFGDRDPKYAPQCKPYIEVHSIDIDNPSDYNDNSKVITASGLRKIINTMFKGLSLDGKIDTLNTNNVNLDDFKDTGAYLLIVNNDLSLGSHPLIPSGSRVLLRVYKSSTLTIQEIINYNLPIIYYRYFTNDWSTWTFISNGNSSAVTQVNLALGEYLNKVSEYTNKIEQIENNSRIVFREVWGQANPEVHLSSINGIQITKGSIIQVGIMTDISNEPRQEWITVDLSIVNAGVVIGPNNSKIYFEVNNVNGNSGSLNIEIRLPTNNAEIFKVLMSGKY